MNDHDCRTLINRLDRLSGVFAEMDDELVKAIAKKNRITWRVQNAVKNLEEAQGMA
ncbi:hypothetical protein ACFQ6V_12285 [Streptomyces roseifaciens]